jgi:phosphoribosylaminoimidazole-succinocarboxamide synthase
MKSSCFFFKESQKLKIIFLEKCAMTTYVNCVGKKYLLYHTQNHKEGAHMSSGFHFKDPHRLPSPPRRRQIYEGQDKILYEGPENNTHVLYFKDETARGEGPCVVASGHQSSIRATTATMIGKGAINNRFSELMLSRIAHMGIPTHFMRRLNMREQLVRATEIIPFHVSLHNSACDHFAKRLGLSEGMELSQPILEFSLKSRELKFPLINHQYICSSGWAEEDELDFIQRTVYRVNDFLSGQFIAHGIQLMSFTLEFGRIYYGESIDATQLMIIDEISPNTCHLRDLRTGKRLDKSVMDSENYDGSSEVYKDLATRFGLFEDGGPPDLKDMPISEPPIKEGT